MQAIKEQYASSKNLETRMSIYQFSVNQRTFPAWLTEQITPDQGITILELGCGTGGLWQDLKKSFPNCEIILSDLSDGMLQKSKEILGETDFKYQIIDFHQIPFPDNYFDVVISNHNLYHAEDLDRVLAEITRVLTCDGTFYATTNSVEHLAQLRELVGVSQLWPNSILTSAFGAESGVTILRKYFANVDLRYYENTLRIDDFQVIENYLMSVRDERIHTIIKNSREKLEKRFAAEMAVTGYFEIKTKAGLFICTP